MDAFQREVGEWADRTFPMSSVASIKGHFAEEADELGREDWFPDSPGRTGGAIVDEAADCLLLLLHLAHKAGFSLEAAAREKLGVNRGRTWETDDGGKGYWKHIDPEAVAVTEGVR